MHLDPRYWTLRKPNGGVVVVAAKSDRMGVVWRDSDAAINVQALRARPPFSAQVRVQRICMVRNIASMATANTANT